MYPIHYVASRKNDQPTDKETSAAVSLADAVAGARSRIRDMNAIFVDPARPHLIGFLIFDAGGSNVLHREYLD